MVKPHRLPIVNYVYKFTYIYLHPKCIVDN